MRSLFVLAIGFMISLSAVATDVSIWQPENGSNVPAENWTTFSGNATSSSGIREVKYYLDGVLFCTKTSSPYNCSYFAKSGTHTLKMVAMDYAWISNEKSITFTVGAGPAPAPVTGSTPIIPTITVFSPANGQSFSPDFWTTFSASATNATNVKYYANGSLVCQVNASPFNCSYKTPASGVISIKAVATSSTGHTAEKTFSITINGSTPVVVAPPVTGPAPIYPTVNLQSPENNKVLQPDFWTTLSSTATNAINVKYFVNGNLLCTTTNGPYFNCSYKTPTSGSVTIKSVATSATGHTAEKSVVISVTGSTSPVTNPGIIIPSLTLMSPEQGRVFDPGFWTTIVSTASNAVKVKYMADSSTICEMTGPPYNCSYPTPLLAGTVTIRAIATSSSGHTTEKSAQIIISSGGATVIQPPLVEPPVVQPPTTTPSDPYLGGSPAPKPRPGYELHFSDEFDNQFGGAPNHAKWDYDINYVRNNEVQCYTDNRRENVRVETRNFEGSANGYLVLELKKEPWNCKQANNNTYQYTSGSITTRKRGWAEYLATMPHGRYEIRAKIPSGRGTWPALWLKGESTLGAWPNSGEIDIMEAVGYDEAAGKYVLYTTIHRPSHFGWPNKWGSTGQGMHYLLQEPPSARFHVWEMEWTPNSLEFFVDGNRVTKLLVAGDQYETRMGLYRSEFVNTNTPAGWPFSMETPGHQFELILNLAYGGEWGGAKGLDDTIFANGKRVEMLVDYVRVYKKLP